MGTKNISITDDVYERILSLKSPSESFSEGIKRLLGEKCSIMEFAGVWNDIPDKDIIEMKKKINDMRKEDTRLREIVKKVR